MLHMDIWMSLACGSIVWGALWSAATLVTRAVRAESARGRQK